MINLHKLNAFLGARVLYFPPRKPSATPKMMTMLIHNASVLTDVFYVGIHFCIKHIEVFLFVQEVELCGFLFCNSSTYLAFQFPTVLPSVQCPIVFVL